MANPQVENGYTRIANELLEALCRARLGGREMRVVLAVIRLTYGYGRKEDRISLAMLEEFTGIRKDALMKTIKSLEAKQILVRKKTGNRLVLGIQKDYERWSFCGNTKKQLSFCGDIKRQPKGTQKDNSRGHKKTTPNLSQSLEPQGFPGSLKKTYKENLKEISSEGDPEGDVKEIVSSWEQTFQVSFPAPASREEIRAADFMLYLYEQGKLPALKSPTAYLKKLAQTELEPFPSLPERRRQAEEAERRLQKLAEREAELVLLRMKAEAEAEEKARKRWEEMPPEAKMELMKEIKLRWPRQPMAFWEKQAITQIKKQILGNVWPDNRAGVTKM